MKNSAARKLKQVPAGYLRVGVDPHKKKHAAVAMTEDLMVHGKFKFANSRRGYEEALEWARAEMLSTGCRGVIFAIETASHFWRNLAYFLDERGVPFRLINQFTLKRRREGRDVNKKKNDFRDAETAAQLLCSGEFTETKLLQGVYAELHAAYSTYHRLIKERTRIINLLKALLDGLFPEFTQVFKELCGHTSLSVLAICPVPKAIAGMTEEEFVNIIRAGHQGRLMRRKLRALHHIAQTSIGIKVDARSVLSEIQLLVERFQLTARQLQRMEESMVRMVDETEEGKYLLSIKGINYISVAGILGGLGPFSSYPSARQLIKMAGSNPTESESAGKRRSHTPMSKKGRARLRHCAWIAVIPLLRVNPDFRAWAKRLRERPVQANPLTGREIVGAGINKLFRLGFALVKKQTLYQVSQLETAKVATGR